MKNIGSNPVKPPFWLLLELTYQCPLHCAYCSNPLELEGEQELNTEEWFEVMTQARQLGAVQLGLSGGEPLMRKDLEQIVAKAHQLGFYTNLITSAIGLTEKRLQAFKAAGLDHIQISFQAADPELNDAIAGKRHAFEQKYRLAKAVKAAGFPMVMNAVITKQNIGDIEALMQLACDIQADYVELATSQYYGWALLNRQALLPSQQQIENAEQQVNAFRDRLPSGSPKFILVTPDYYEKRPKPCMSGWGSLFACINPYGLALPCHSAAVLPITFPNVRTHNFKQIWYESDAFNRFRGNEWMQEPCRSCPEKEQDFAGCRCQAMLLTGDATNADPVCEHSPHHHVIEQSRQEAQVGCHSELVVRSMRTDRLIVQSRL